MGGLASYKRQIPNGKSTTLTARGQLLVLRSAQGTVDVSTIQNQTSDKDGERYSLTLRRGQKWRAPTDFDGIEISNSAGFDQTIEILVGYGDYQEPAPDINAADIIFSAPNLKVIDTEIPILVVDSNPSRKSIVVKNYKTSEQTVLLAGSTDEFDAVGGYPLAPGESQEFQVRGAIYALAAANGNNVIASVEQVDNALGPIPGSEFTTSTQITGADSAAGSFSGTWETAETGWNDNTMPSAGFGAATTLLNTLYGGGTITGLTWRAQTAGDGTPKLMVVIDTNDSQPFVRMNIQQLDAGGAPTGPVHTYNIGDATPFARDANGADNPAGPWFGFEWADAPQEFFDGQNTLVELRYQ